MSKKVTIVEVGPRDGLQNEADILSEKNRAQLIQKLCASGLKRIEVGSFVSPHWVPQMAGTSKVLRFLESSQKKGVLSKQCLFSALVPNAKGFQDALGCGVKEVALFTACSESFTKRNINVSIQQSLIQFQPLVQQAKHHRLKVRGYLSTVFGCPYEGNVKLSRVLRMIDQLFKLGVDEISLGDTIGVATPKQVEKLLKHFECSSVLSHLAMHFHDTRGMAIANILQSLDQGIRIFDSSIGGLGGCPYSPGASGNVATEDVVYLLKGQGMRTGVDLDQLVLVNRWLSRLLKRTLSSKVALTY